MATGTLTSKGQITIPKEIRDYLHLSTGQRITFSIEKNGVVTLRPKRDDILSLRGIVKSPHKRPVTIEEMNETIAMGWAGLLDKK